MRKWWDASLSAAGTAGSCAARDDASYGGTRLTSRIQAALGAHRSGGRPAGRRPLLDLGQPGQPSYPGDSRSAGTVCRGAWRAAWCAVLRQEPHGDQRPERRSGGALVYHQRAAADRADDWTYPARLHPVRGPPASANRGDRRPEQLAGLCRSAAVLSEPWPGQPRRPGQGSHRHDQPGWHDHGLLTAMSSDGATILVRGENNHGVAKTFVDFMQQQGLIYENGRYVRGQLYDPLFVFGLPSRAPTGSRLGLGVSSARFCSRSLSAGCWPTTRLTRRSGV